MAVALAAIALSLATIEVVARLARRGRGAGREGNERALYAQADPRLGWRKKPGAKATYRRREYTVEVAVNAAGLRDRERTIDKPPGVFRILAVGDSFVEGYTVPLESTVSQRLEQQLGGACAVEVLNGGTQGYSTDQEYLFYVEDGQRYAPDVVLLFFYYNDVVPNTWKNAWGAPKPLLWFSNGEPEIANFPVPAPAVAAAAPAPARRQPAGSAAWAWVQERVSRGAPRAYKRLASVGLWPAIDVEAIEPGDQMRVYKRHHQPPIEAAWTLTGRILAAFARAAAARGTRFVVVYVPNRFEVNDRDWELTQMRYGLTPGLWERELVRSRLQEIGRSVPFPVLDLTPALRAADRGLLGGPYLQFDAHWNERGHAAAARTVGTWLRSQGWLPACAGASRSG
jgi:hypothetical protein